MSVDPGPIRAMPQPEAVNPFDYPDQHKFVPVELFRARRSIPLGEPIRWYLLITEMENYRREYGDRLIEVWDLVDQGRLDEAEARFDRRVGGGNYA